LPSHILPFQTVGLYDFGKILTICSQFCLPEKIIRSPRCILMAIYTILLTHLHNNTSSKLPLSTIQGALAHHLATALPLPTPLAATAISLPPHLSQPFTNEKLQSFSTAFRHATHLKYRAFADAVNSRSTLSTLLGKSAGSDRPVGL
jgi:hypothetical protein